MSRSDKGVARRRYNVDRTNYPNLLAEQLKELAERAGLKIKFGEGKISQYPWVVSSVIIAPKDVVIKSRRTPGVIKVFTFHQKQSEGSTKNCGRYRAYAEAYYFLASYEG
jgi:hypothetical protein